MTSVVAVVVTYGPDERTAQLLRALAPQVARIVVVDNGSPPAALAQIKAAIDDVGAQLVELGENTGIANAQNVGIVRARELGATHVLLSDQDSLPAPDMVERLLDTLQYYGQTENGAAEPIGAVGPYIAEAKPGGDELVYVDRRWGPRRASAAELSEPHVDAAFLLASGCLIPVDVLADVGPMNANYFIDHVDLEWCLRARTKGYRLVVDTRARIDHSLGDQTVQLPGRAQPVHVHGPVRCYYLARNTIFLLRSGLLPGAWRVGYLVWLAKFAAFHALLADRKRDRIRQLAAGLRDGIMGRGGPR
ncbi:glycosyltransferase family 2 protein [Trueperella bialowiezensis]|uniref:Rhamnosyltransferase n=1 Tax=Trueperella bialowiezensis TaxID=312285 RepID=A0A3S4VA36_9ACTO|nr:glycosyltransferase family 2 protein [Trueperella bialowiezensis]VEI12934.1 rhamnosyltransferase [Trueperella bialowiezensis]